jgi:hypothetical protein
LVGAQDLHKIVLLELTAVLCPDIINRGLKMEKIVVLTGNRRNDNLIKCLEMLFPECMIEILNKKPEAEKETFSQIPRKMV